MVGRYKTIADSMYVDYVRPQENGHRTDTRWVVLSDKSGRGLLVQAENTIGFNALRNTIEDFDAEDSSRPYQWRNRSPEEIENHDLDEAKNAMRKIKSGEKIRIVFSENSAFEPVIANLILTFGEPVNILKADTKNVGGVAKGEMILEFMEGSTRTEMMKQYLKEKGLAIGEVTGYVGS